MASRADLPPALAALVDAALGLVRRAPSARIVIARAGGLVDPDALPDDLRAAVERELEEARAAVLVELPLRDVERVLRGAWDQAPTKVLDDLEPEPLAVTPTGQVHRGTLDGTAVAVKVRRPGVERAVRSYLALLDVLAAPLRAAFPRLDAGAVLRDVREQALDELDLEHEGSTLRRVGRALRRVEGVTTPRPMLELSAPDVLVAELLEGPTLADGARPDDPAAAARLLARAMRAAVLDAGLAPYDQRRGHVVVQPDGRLGLLGMGVARPVDPARARAWLAAAEAVRAGDADRFAAALQRLELLDGGRAAAAHELLRDLAGPLLDRAMPPDLSELRDAGTRIRAAAAELAELAASAAPRPVDLVLARTAAQTAAILARLMTAGDRSRRA